MPTRSQGWSPRSRPLRSLGTITCRSVVSTRNRARRSYGIAFGASSRIASATVREFAERPSGRHCTNALYRTTLTGGPRRCLPNRSPEPTRLSAGLGRRSENRRQALAVYRRQSIQPVGKVELIEQQHDNGYPGRLPPAFGGLKHDVAREEQEPEKTHRKSQGCSDCSFGPSHRIT